MKKYLLTFMLSITIFFTSFSINVSAESFPTFPSGLTGNLLYIANNINVYEDTDTFNGLNVGFNLLNTSSYAIFFNSSEQLLYFVPFTSMSSLQAVVVTGPAVTIDMNRVVSSKASATYNLNSSGISCLYLRVNNMEFVNLTKYHIGSFGSHYQFSLPYVSDFSSIMYQRYVIPTKFTTSGTFTVNGDANYTDLGAMQCSYNESTGNISCTNPNSDYDISFTINANNVSSTVTTTVATLYLNTQTFYFDDYYSGYFTIPNSVTATVDGGALVGNTVYVTDSKQVTFSWITLNSSAPTQLISDITNFVLFKSRFSYGYLLSFVDIIADNVKLITNGYEDMEQSSDNITSSNGQLSGAINDYDSLEKEQIDNMTSAIDQIDTNNGLFQMQDFIKSSQWVSTQILQVYNSNTILKYIVTFSLLTGLSLMIIGRRWH